MTTYLNEIWFLLLGVLLTGYAVLDGFDLGVGILHPFVAREDRERRILMNAIGPLWDGNEVWLVTFGGAMFAAFRDVYATVFSAFYTAFMLLLCALIFRAVSMEFRSKQPHPAWRSLWDWAFCVSSLTASLLFGVAVGNVMQGIAIDANGNYVGTFFDFLNVFSLLTGLLVVALFAFHGGLYLTLKTGGPLHARVLRASWIAYFCLLALYVAVSAYAVAAVPSATVNFRYLPAAWIMPLLHLAAMIAIPLLMRAGRTGLAFLANCFCIAAFVFLFAVAMAPNMVYSSLNPEHTLTIYNAASSPKTLGIMLVIALIGMPLVISYTVIIYRVFRGKVELTPESY